MKVKPSVKKDAINVKLLNAKDESWSFAKKNLGTNKNKGSRHIA